MTKPFENTKEPRFDNAFIFDTPQKMFSVGADVHTYGIYSAGVETYVTDGAGVEEYGNLRDGVSAGSFGGTQTAVFTSYRAYPSPEGFSHGMHSLDMDGGGDAYTGNISTDLWFQDATRRSYEIPYILGDNIYMWFTNRYGTFPAPTTYKHRLGKKTGSNWQDVTPAFVPDVNRSQFLGFMNGKALHLLDPVTSPQTYFTVDNNDNVVQLSGFTLEYAMGKTSIFSGNGYWTARLATPNVLSSYELQRYNYNGTATASDGVSYVYPGYGDFGVGLTDASFSVEEIANESTGKFYLILTRVSTGATKIYEYTPGTATPTIISSFSIDAGYFVRIRALGNQGKMPLVLPTYRQASESNYGGTEPARIYVATTSGATFFGAAPTSEIYASRDYVTYSIDGTAVSMVSLDTTANKYIAYPVIP